MGIEVLELTREANGHGIYGYILFNTESKNAILVVAVYKGKRLLTLQWGGCTCNECIGGDFEAHHVFVAYIMDIVREHSLELLESYHKEEEELFHFQREYWARLSSWWIVNGLHY